ncbi:MAG TPA: NUDIX domain-containing protein [Patescibacteria group bacterium]|nr:NUDIX domain-containing protein [Patescibacteria group bacterium]
MTLPHKQLTIVLGIVERDDRFLVLRRVDEVPMRHHKWEFPGGKIEAGETPTDALRREVLEETGLQIGEPELLGIHTHHWHFSDFVQQTFLIAYRVATVSANEVVLCPGENDAHQWVTLDEFFELSDHLEANKAMLERLYVPIVEKG